MKRLVASAALALAVSAGGAGLAQAATYTLNVDSCSGGCGYSTYGTVDVTGEGTDTLNFSIHLDPGIYFNQAGGGHDSFAFDLVGGPTVTLSGVPTKFAANGVQAQGHHHEDGLGYFGYVVDWVGPPKNNGTLTTQNLSFTVTGSGPLTLGHTDADTPIYFSADVATFGGASTGVVGATLGGGVPEPASWAIMLMGFGGLGAALRRRREAAVLA